MRTPFPWKELGAADTSFELTEGLRHFTDCYAEQFSVRIPSGILPRIDVLRDTYLPYLNDSEYKSNICYLLHLIQYQLWHYKIFKPKLSLENAFFYQQMVTLGIIAEALAHAVLLNPCIEADKADRSRGRVAAAYIALHEQISRRSFAQNIDLMAALNIISPEIRNEYHRIRLKVRNLVHIQGWEGRIYQSVTHEYFSSQLKSFMKFLGELKNNINMNFSAAELSDNLSGSREIYYGKIISYFSDKGYGFISSHDFPENVFFHISEYAAAEKPVIDTEVSFNIKQSPKGPLAVRVKNIVS